MVLGFFGITIITEVSILVGLGVVFIISYFMKKSTCSVECNLSNSNTKCEECQRCEECPKNNFYTVPEIGLSQNYKLEVGVTTEQHCAQACSDNYKCGGYTFITQDTGFNTCYLSQDLEISNIKKTDSTYSSGFKCAIADCIEPSSSENSSYVTLPSAFNEPSSVTAIDAVKENVSIYASNEEDCRNYCDSQEDCKYYTYYEDLNKCHGYSEMDDEITTDEIEDSTKVPYTFKSNTILTTTIT